jgi:thymidylate synthase (FAD)
MISPASDQGSDNFFGFTDSDGENILKRIEWCGRISHRSEDLQTEDSFERFIRSVVLGHGDLSIAEHESVSVDALVDRGITHEWVRHRLGAYTQESTRFVRYFKEKEGDVVQPAQFIYPKPYVECRLCLLSEDLTDLSANNEPYELDDDHWGHTPNKHYSAIDPNETGYCAYDPLWLKAIDTVEETYKALLKIGWRPQEARSVFPNALASRIVVTYNLRMWRHFFLMRTSAEAHPQMRQVTIPLLQEFQEKIPILFEDIQPNQKQAENMKKMR